MKKNIKTRSILNSIRKKYSSFKKRADQLKKEQNNVNSLEIVSKTPKTFKTNKKEKTVIEFSVWNVVLSILAVLGVIIGFYLLYLISNILILFFVAFFIAAALNPVIDSLEKNKIPRAVGIILVYIILFILVALFIARLLPLLADQMIAIAKQINHFIYQVSTTDISSWPYAKEIGPYVKELFAAVDMKVIALQLENSLQIISSQILSLGGNLWTILMIITNGLFNLLLVIILVFFMTVDEKSIRNFCLSIFPSKFSPYISRRLEMVNTKIGHWIRGQLLVSLIAGLITFIGLALLGVPYSLTHAVITAVFMLIPIFGRLFAWVISFPIIFSVSPVLALYMTIYYLAVSQVENNIMIPYLMNKAVGLSPILIIFALMVGLQFLGILGLVLAIPIATIIAIFVKDIGAKIKAV